VKVKVVFGKEPGVTLTDAAVGISNGGGGSTARWLARPAPSIRGDVSAGRLRCCRNSREDQELVCGSEGFTSYRFREALTFAAFGGGGIPLPCSIGTPTVWSKLVFLTLLGR
jgi:hypothetical protein